MSYPATSVWAAFGLAVCVGCAAPPPAGVPAHSSSIAVSADGAQVFVANPDSDSVSIIDTRTRELAREVLLAPAAPRAAVDGSFTPAVMPRAVALSWDNRTLFVSGQRSGRVHAIDLDTFAVRASEPVGSEPIGLLTDGRSVFVACSQEGAVVKLDATTLALKGRVDGLPDKPWALAWNSSASTLLVTHFHRGGVSRIDPGKMTALDAWAVPDVAPRDDKRLAQGEARSLYDVAARPGSDEVWVPHALLASATPQPDLDFESTTFAALTVLRAGRPLTTLSIDALGVPGIDGAFADVVSGPRALAFTPDGALALMLDQNSEDVLVVDAELKVQVSLLRPLPGDLPEGLALAADGVTAYVDERATGDVAVLKLDPVSRTLKVDGRAIPRLTSDPMPQLLRQGQRLFFSANSDELPLSNNHWVACATCHPEGRSDEVTWRFFEGPRDTPTNAGGMRGTGFLLHTGGRTRLQDYWKTIVVEQGGRMEAGDPLLDALAAFVDLGLPLPLPPATDAQKVAQGKTLFERADVGCAQCHFGPRLTDSGQGNPMLSLSGPVVLHDVGTCAVDGFRDVAHEDIEGHPREACLFDTPSLSGLTASPPYLHDGSAATLRDVLERTRGRMGDIRSLSEAELEALVEYLRSL